MTASQDNASVERAAWKRVFVDVLIGRMPDLNPDAADDASDEQYLLVPHQSPERAAADYAHARKVQADKLAVGQSGLSPADVNRSDGSR